MAELTREFENAEVSTPASRLERVESLHSASGWSWYKGKFKAREAELLELCANTTLSLNERDGYGHELKAIRWALNLDRIELETATTDLKRVLHRQDPSQPISEPML